MLHGSVQKSDDEISSQYGMADIRLAFAPHKQPCYPPNTFLIHFLSLVAPL